jgi:hypothetical protein
MTSNVKFAYEQHAAPAYDPNHETNYCDMIFKLAPEGEGTRLILTCPVNVSFIYRAFLNIRSISFSILCFYFIRET